MSKQPLIVQLLFHPESKSARALAQHIHGQLNDDVVVPGLRVPTVFCPVSDGLRPPAKHRLTVAERSFVVPLADDQMRIDDDWSQFVGDLWLACQNSPHRCVPMQLSKNAWPLDQRLRGVNFGRAFALPEGEERNAWVTRRVVIELCRFLRGIETTDDRSRAPLELFLSHAKVDLGAEPKAAQKFIDYLTVDQPVEAWVDSGKIETGSKFAEAIEAGVKRTSLLVILTDNYSSREWCREEVMLAKEYQRPLAVIDALMSHEVRSFPFLENIPKLRWSGSPAKGVDLLLKETLRQLHTSAVLESSKQPGDTVFLRPPEPATLLGVAPGSVILYPDPLLGVGESKRLAQSKLTFTTPLERSAQGRSLEGRLIALSMSESTDIARWGQDLLHLSQTMLELSRHLLIRGATLAYGGHLGSQGYTQRLFELVRTHNDQEGVKPFERIVNHRGWPLPKLSTSELAELKQVSTTVRIPRPADIVESWDVAFVAEPERFFPGDSSAEHRYAWCRGMTEMRAFQSDRSKSGVIARVVLGGTFGPTLKEIEGQPPKEQWYSSRMPGVLEEVLLSIQNGQPVFLIGAFGGVAKLVIDLLQGQTNAAATWEFQSKAPFATATREFYAKRGQKWWYYGDEPRLADLAVDDSRSIVDFLADAWKPRTDKPWETGINPLTRDENLELFETVDPTRMIELLVKGLSGLVA
jgi:SLOG cluster2/TIR domain